MKELIKNIFRRAFLLANSPVKRTNWYKNVEPEFGKFPVERWYRKNFERNYDIVNVGSSSALYAFDYEGLGVKAFNWAMQPQSMEYSFKILKMFHSILKLNGIVLIPFSPFSGLSVKGKWNESLNDRYYGILDPMLIDGFENVLRRRQYPLLTNTKLAIKRLIKDEPPRNRQKKITIVTTREEFEKDAENWMAIWKNEFRILDLESPLSPENMAGRLSRKNIVAEMIGFCMERDYQPVIVIPPVHSSLSALMTDRFKELYIYSFLREIQECENIPLLDYLVDTNFQDSALYYNSFFLNKKGARLFTKVLLDDLKKMKVL